MSDDDVVDLISDDDTASSAAGAAGAAAPPAASHPAQLHFDPMFDSDEDVAFMSDAPQAFAAPPPADALAPHASATAGGFAAAALSISSDSSDASSDAELAALVALSRRMPPMLPSEPPALHPFLQSPAPASAPRAPPPPPAPPADVDDTAVDSDSEWELQHDRDAINPALLDDGPQQYVNPSLDARRPAAAPPGGVSNAEVLELVKLNSLSSDATKELPTPPEMNVVLLKHQRQALAWMQDRESDAHDKPAGHPRGGILADDQGFGKTLSVISLMITNQPPMRDGATRPPAWGNLVICPTSIMHQWASELDARIDAPYKPRVLVYHGAKRPKDPYVLVKYDVIVTSYGMARQEYPKVLERDKDRVPIRRRKKGPLYRLKWFRVILDEAQAIKNHRGDTFSACTLLQADRRWSLSGTPIQNTVDDIYSQFLFIRYFLVADYSEWRRKYKRPLESSRGSREALFKRFQATLGVVLLRRAKSDKIDGKPVIELPKRIVTLRELEFSKIERDYYQAQEDRAVEAMARFGIREGFTTALTILLRLRQACGHPDLCDWGGDRNFNFSEEELDAVDRRMMTSSLFKALPPDIQERLGVELSPGTEVQQTCPICIEFITENGVVTKCGHVFCTPDFDQWNRNNDSCPSCRAGLGAENEIMSLAEVRKEVHALDRMKRKLEAVEVGAPVKAETKPAKLEITIGGKRNPGDSFDESPTKRRCKGEKNAVAVDFGNESSAKKELKFEDVMEEGNSEDALEDGEKQPLSSTKIMAFLSEYDTILNATEDKVLCYSQWTRMLDLVEDEVLQRGHEYVRLDGTMSPHQRSAAINTFNTKDKCRLFLISMQAGSTGLNLTAANRVFLLDSWWNPTVEEQAIDRAHRIGQRKDVDVVRFKIHNSVEDKILALQERKRELINGALGVEGLKTMGRRRLTFRDVMSLFTDVASNVAARAGAAQNTELQNFAHIVQDAQLDMGL